MVLGNISGFYLKYFFAKWKLNEKTTKKRFQKMF